jgi:beta-glucanase (GH16 family)
MLRKFLASLAILCGAAAPLAGAIAEDCATTDDDHVFYDDFSMPELDRCRWSAVEENWGGKSGDEDYNGGVTPANVEIVEGEARLSALGNFYTGPVRGTGSDGRPRPNGRRAGAAIMTRQRFLGGRFEARVAIAARFGVCSAMWTYFHESLPGLPERNHEIDIEFPGREHINAPPSFRHVAFTTWTGLVNGQSTTAFRALSGDDADFRILRFDWYPPINGSGGRVDFYMDDQLLYTALENVPSEPAPLWLGVWFPQVWAGQPDFVKAVMRVDWVRIAPVADRRPD